LVHALAPADQPVAERARVPWDQQAAALALALCSLLLGLVPWDAYLPMPPRAGSASPVLQTLSSVLWPILAGGMLGILLGRWKDWSARVPLRKLAKGAIGPARRAAVLLGGMIERIDGALRQWPAAVLSLLALTILFGAALLTR